jgi:nucleoside-diphosphate-sugar epimerase
LVTGATGFIGGRLALRLLDRGLVGRPVEMACLVRDQSRLPPTLRTAVQILPGRLQDLPSLREDIEGCHFVFHLAAEASYRADEEGYRNNVEGTRALLEALRSGKALQRVVFASSVGAVDRSPGDDCAKPLDEDSPAHPLTRYGESKLACERLIQQSGVPFAIVRPTWVYGPGMRSESHVRALIRFAERGHPLSHVDFPGRVSLVHVDDLVEALLLAAVHAEAAGRTFFATDGDPVSIGQISREIGEHLGRRRGYLRPPRSLVAAARRWRARLPLTAQNLFSDVLCANEARLRAIGFEPRVARRRGLLETIRWHRLQSGVRSDQGVCLITGAASGIGRALAEQLHAEGRDLLLIDRSCAQLEELAQALKARHLCVDLGQASELARLRAFLEETGLDLSWVVNCAGIGLRGPVAELPLEAQLQIVDVNVRAVLYLSKLAVDHFRGRGKGCLVNVASTAAFQPLPLMAAYAASKSFVLTFSEALWAEAEELGDVRIVTVVPAGTDTDFQRQAGVRRAAGERLLSPVRVASAIRAAAGRRGPTVLVGTRARQMALLSRVLSRRRSALLWRRLMERLR